MHHFRPAFSFGLFVLLALFASDVDAASLALAWDPPIDGQTAGYIVLYGTAPGVYSHRVEIGLTTSHRIDGLDEGTRYFFSVQAYDTQGERSALADEVWATTSNSGGVGRDDTEADSRTGSSERSFAVEATRSEGGIVNITWVAPPGAVTGYRVEVGDAQGRTAYSAFTTKLEISFDANVLPDQDFFVRVRSIIGGGRFAALAETVVGAASDLREPPTSPVTNTPGECATPQAPQRLEAGAQGSAVRVTWQAGVGPAPTGYVLHVGSAPGRQDLMTIPLGVARELNALARDGNYALRLAATNHCGPSVWAAETVLQVRTNVALPGAPAALTEDLTGGLLTLSWQAPSTGGGVTRYLIEATTPFGPFAYDTGTPGTRFSAADAPPGVYVVTVRAGNAAGFGPASRPITVVIP